MSTFRTFDAARAESVTTPPDPPAGRRRSRTL